MPSISIILPVFNGESYVRDTIDSILGQTFSDFELICVDDGSTDGSLKILESISASDPRVTVLTQKNQGPGAARNKGLDAATGSYVAMLDADDLYSENLLEKLYSKATKIDADIVVTRSSEFEDGTGRNVDAWWTLNVCQIPNKEIFSSLEMRDFIFTAFIGWPWDKLFRRSFIEKHGIRYPVLPNSEDLYFVFLALAKADRIGIVDEPLIRHRIGRGGSVSSSRAKAPLAFYESICLLKNKLREDEAFYSSISWGFLNWAFEYTIWNIETMTDKHARIIQLDALLHDQLPELEVASHSPAFYSLIPGSYDRYLGLLEEASDAFTSHGRTRLKIILPRLIRLLCLINDNGFLYTLKYSFSWFIGKLAPRSSTAGEAPKLIRGKDFAITGADARRGILDRETEQNEQIKGR